jgi:hypothetical protein
MMKDNDSTQIPVDHLREKEYQSFAYSKDDNPNKEFVSAVRRATLKRLNQN